MSIPDIWREMFVTKKNNRKDWRDLSGKRYWKICENNRLRLDEWRNIADLYLFGLGEIHWAIIFPRFANANYLISMYVHIRDRELNGLTDSCNIDLLNGQIQTFFDVEGVVLADSRTSGTRISWKKFFSLRLKTYDTVSPSALLIGVIANWSGDPARA